MLILIADDDRLVRFSIKSMLGEILGDLGDVFIEAVNGRDMVKLCRERKPDIAFVDIKMPYMSGLDAISESKNYSADTDFVIISGYSDFEYAQKGISLGVNEYILKPVDEEELRRVIEKLQEKLKVRKEESNARFQLLVMEWFTGHSLISTQEYISHYQEDSYIYLAFVLYVKTNVHNRAASMQFQQELVGNIRRLGEQTVTRKGYYAIPATKEGFPCGLFWVRREQREYMISHIRKLIMEAKRKNGEIFQYVLWFERESLEEICQTCDELDRQIYMGMNFCSGNVYSYEELSLDQKNREFLKLVDQLLNAWEMADGMTCNEIMNKLWRTYKDETLDVNLKNVSKYCFFITGSHIADDSLKAFCRSFVEHSEQMYERAAGEESDMIERVKKYIMEYYMNDISISQIADNYELTANYLSTVFHRKTGCRFIDYLTQVRMEAAKKLLIQNASASVQDVALMVGYNSARHFSSLFQKTTGETPTAYRKARL